MTFKDHGYYGYAYIGSRAVSAIAIISIIGMAAHSVSLVAKTHHEPPGELTATVVFSVLALFWTLFSLTAYDDTHLPYPLTAALDLLFVVPFISLAVLLGQPLAITTCAGLPQNITISLAGLPHGTRASYPLFASASQDTCYELTSVWGLVISLCILLVVSGAAAGFLWLGKQRASGAGGGETKGTSVASSVVDEEWSAGSCMYPFQGHPSAMYHTPLPKEEGGYLGPYGLGIHTPPQATAPRTFA